MTLAPVWRTRLAAAGAAVFAVWMGTAIAQHEFLLPTVCLAVLGVVMVIYVQPLPPTTVLLGLTLLGYMVGNRGFAQLSFTSSFPILPGELVLLVAGITLLVRSALHRTIPVRRDLLNALVLLWMITSSVRLYLDVRMHGALALRDYAMVYYAAFFFIAQHAATTAVERSFLLRCLLWACASLLIVYPLFNEFSDFFINRLTLYGTPIIFFKGDLAGTFMVIGAVLFFARWEEHGSRFALILSLLLAGAAIATTNRASMLGLFVATFLLAVAGRWRLALAQTALAVIVIAGFLSFAYLRNQSWQTTPVHGLYERIVSLTDPSGQRSYTASDAFNKGDNNLFRMVWWRLVYEETSASSPIVGLGFGHDLAGRFVREYYPDIDEFTTRSPHNFLVTVFARTGLVGLIPFLAIIAAVFWRTVRAARQDIANGAMWCAATTVLISAIFGVVLEGPMGAVVFWAMLGMANAGYSNKSPENVSDSADPKLELEPAPTA